MWREELKRKSSFGVPSRVQFQPLFATSMNFESLKPARPGPLGCLVGYSLDRASRIEPEFPERIYDREMVRAISYGGTRDRLLL
jgi:hypothetical protein